MACKQAMSWWPGKATTQGSEKHMACKQAMPPKPFLQIPTVSGGMEIPRFLRDSHERSIHNFYAIRHGDPCGVAMPPNILFWAIPHCDPFGVAMPPATSGSGKFFQ
ncbi:MAG: hypothetical protein K8S55_12130 [Phycisphaerae bacterium]|nr:hypothetical protein [Phycisphaerae bacterium]